MEPLQWFTGESCCRECILFYLGITNQRATPHCVMHQSVWDPVAVKSCFQCFCCDCVLACGWHSAALWFPWTWMQLSQLQYKEAVRIKLEVNAQVKKISSRIEYNVFIRYLFHVTDSQDAGDSWSVGLIFVSTFVAKISPNTSHTNVWISKPAQLTFSRCVPSLFV